MPKPDLADLRELVSPSLRYAGVELVDLQWGGGTLRLVIDRPGGVTLDDCEKVSTSVSAALDAYDPIQGRYMLEVTSPGAERPLRSHEDWQSALGKHVAVRYRTDDSEVSLQGLLSAVTDKTVMITTMKNTRATEHEIALDDVLSARIAIVILRRWLKGQLRSIFPVCLPTCAKTEWTPNRSASCCIRRRHQSH